MLSGSEGVIEGSDEWFRAYGMLIRSSIPLPEMIRVDPSTLAPPSREDVTITLGATPRHLDEPIATGVGHEEDADHFLMWVEGVGRYLVSHGTRIVIDPVPDATAHELRVFMLGTCLGVLLHQRGLLVLHASGIGTGRGAVLFAGASGAGKSTLLAEFLRRGHRMMVDDVCAITVLEDAEPIVVPSYPRTRLWGETAARLAIDTTALPRTRPQMDKYERQVADQFWDEAAPVARIYHLAGSIGDELSLTRLGPLDAFQAVLDNTYRQVLLDGLDRRGEHFDLAARVARSAQVTRVVRPTRTFRLEELADLIADDLAAE